MDRNTLLQVELRKLVNVEEKVREEDYFFSPFNSLLDCCFRKVGDIPRSSSELIKADHNLLAGSSCGMIASSYMQGEDGEENYQPCLSGTLWKEESSSNSIRQVDDLAYLIRVWSSVGERTEKN